MREDAVTPARERELKAGLTQTRERIDAACRAAGRRPDEVQLTVVTKTYPAADVLALARLGVSGVGENRHPEAERKRALVVDQAADLRWHFIGGLQSNKAARVAGYADVVESVDRAELLGPLARGVQARQANDERRVLDVLVQVNLDPQAPAGRAGAQPHDVPALAEAVLAESTLRLRGVMAVAPPAWDPDRAFAQLAETARIVRALAPSADWISAGMSGDLEQAVAHGATHVRVGSAILGSRAQAG